MSIEYIIPAGIPAVEQTPYDLGLDRSQSQRVLFLANGYVDSLVTLEMLAISLTTRAPGIRIELRSKGSTMIDAAKPLTDDALNEMAVSFDGLVTAYGHCGSCTSATTRDAVAFARRRRASVALVTEKFAEEASLVARASGMAGLPIVHLPHPMSGIDAHRRMVAVERAADDVAALLFGSDDLVATHPAVR